MNEIKGSRKNKNLTSVPFNPKINLNKNVKNCPTSKAYISTIYTVLYNI